VKDPRTAPITAHRRARRLSGGVRVVDPQVHTRCLLLLGAVG